MACPIQSEVAPLSHPTQMGMPGTGAEEPVSGPLVLWSYGPDPDLKGSPLMPATVTSCLLPQVTSAWHFQVPPPIASVSWRNLLVLTECPVQTSPRGAVMGTGEHVPPHTQHGLDAAADASPTVHCIIFGGVPQGEHSFPNPSFTYST